MSSVLRCLNLAKQFRNVSQSPKSKISIVPIRNGSTEGWCYRSSKTKEMNATSEKYAEYLCASAWWWFLWHCWHDYELVTGEFPNIFPEEWTDEELGLPPK